MRIKIPYTLRILFPIVGWGLLCAAFAYFLVLIMAPFREIGAKGAFTVAVPVFILMVLILTIIKYSGTGFWGTSDIKVINRNLDEKGLKSGISTEEVEKTFYAMVSVCKETLSSSLVAGVALIVLVIFAVWLNGTSLYDAMVILMAGLLALFFMAAFASFFCQQSMFLMLKECRRILVERNEKMEDIELSGIGAKFYFLFLVPFITVLIVLACIYPVQSNIITISMIGLVMTFIINQILFSYLSDSFFEIENFAKELPKGERAIFTTGSLDKEFVSMAENLNKASEEIYVSRRDSERSKEELEKRVAELEKFFNLTLNREMKMVELKKEIKELKGEDVFKDNA